VVAERIVSLIASATEILCALGLRDRLVGVSHECDYPADVRGLPVLSEPKIDPGRPGGEIDGSVRALVREGLSVYRVKTDLLEQLRPDLVVTQDQCEVCAVSLRDVEAACAALARTDVRVCSLRPNVLDDVRADFRRVGEAAGVPERAADLVASFDARLAALAARTRGLARPRVALVEWLDPPMVAGGWMPELARLAGAEPVIVTAAERFRTVTWDEIGAADPDAVVLLPCGWAPDRTRAELADPSTAAAVRALRATRAGRTWVADGNAFFNRPGPRLADSAAILAAILHAGAFGAPPPAATAAPWGSR
jgi:iron complex transport system substrate-binding protein